LQNLIFIGLGFAIVMGVLAALWGVCAGVGVIFKRVESAKAAKAAKAAEEPGPQMPEGTPPAHVAAIAAAVASLSTAYRIVRVHAPPHMSKSWAGLGRLDQHSGRRVRTAWAAPGHSHAAHTLNTRNDGSRET